MAPRKHPVPKEAAIAALRVVDGDLSLEALKRGGLNSHRATTLTRFLDGLGYIRREGRRRMLTVFIGDVIAAIQREPGSAITRQEAVAVTALPKHYRVVLDPHSLLEPGEILSQVYVETLLTEDWPEVQGLELETDGCVYRIYGGELHELQDREGE